MLDFPLLLPILPFINFAFCCSPGLLNFQASCLTSTSSAGGGLSFEMQLPAQPTAAFHFFLPVSTASQSSLVSQLTEQLKKKKKNSIQSHLRLCESSEPQSLTVLFQRVANLSGARSSTIMGVRVRNREVLRNSEIGN